MDTTIYLRFHIKKSKTNKKGLTPVMMRVTLEGKRSEINIGRNVEPDKWNAKSEKMMGRSIEANDLNDYIELMRKKAKDVQKSFVENSEMLTLGKFVRRFKGEEKDKSRMLLEVFKEHNAQTDTLAGKDISVSTAQRYWTCYGHVGQFIKEVYKEDDLRLKDIDHQFITRFEFFLKTVRECNHNSALKYINNFKKIIRIAIANQWIDRNPFYNYKVQFETVERDFLTEDEVQTLTEKNLHLDRLDLVRDMFVFCCYTGLAYADVEKLTMSDITKGIDGDKWIRIKRTKTNTPSSIPLLPVAEAIIEKYEAHPKVKTGICLIPVFSNQKSNAFLKEIALMCGITKTLTTHLARHTFATTITLTNGVPIESVSKMLGHKSLRTTQHYAKIVDRKVSDDMKVLKGKLEAKTKKNENDPEHFSLD